MVNSYLNIILIKYEILAAVLVKILLIFKVKQVVKFKFPLKFATDIWRAQLALQCMPLHGNSKPG